MSTASTKSPMMCMNETAPAIAAIAVRSSTSAVASLTRPSPSSTVTIRAGMPSRLPTAVAATASGGETTAPTAMAAASPISGTSQCRKKPTTTAETMTRTTASAEIAVKFRRKSPAGTVIAAEYRIGGRMMNRIRCGSSTSSGAPGMNPAAAPSRTNKIGEATPIRGANRDTATITRTMSARTTAVSSIPGAPSAVAGLSRR